jgi:SNF2 family DNA or RNA helicase
LTLLTEPPPTNKKTKKVAVADEKELRRVKWQFMVLDEAQAIKSASSRRWSALLSFPCRNRLLLVRLFFCLCVFV